MDRVTVVWLGNPPPPPRFSQAALTLGLRIELAQDISSDTLWREDLFSIIVAAEPRRWGKAYARLSRMAGMLRVQDYGILLAISSPDNAVASNVEAHVAKALDRTPSDIRIIRWDTEEFAVTMRDHKPGPAANRNLDIPQLNQGNLDGILLRRGFSKFQGITLEELDGGRSPGCKVWKVEARRTQAGACEPFVAKAAVRGDLMEERNTYLEFVRDSIPFPFQAPMLADMCVEGGERGLLVSAFVNHASRLDDYLASPTSPALVLASLFERALGPRRRETTREQVSLGVQYVEEQANSEKPGQQKHPLLPARNRLSMAFEHATATDATVSSPDQLWELLRKMPKQEHRFCFIHGDLNVRNVFVRWNAIDTVLIDFSHSGIQDSLARDPAKLDTSIALNVGVRTRDSEDVKLKESDLRKIYTAPLLTSLGDLSNDNRLEAIRQIRRHVAADGISEYEYAVLIACHLLKYAQAPAIPADDKPIQAPRRCVAYELAAGLLNRCLHP